MNVEHKWAYNDWGALLRELVVFNNCKRVVEAGVDRGSTTKYLCEGLQKTGGFLWGFDEWSRHGLNKEFDQNYTKEDVEEYLKPFANYRLTKINTQSPNFGEIVKEQTGGLIDFYFCDCGHASVEVINDFKQVYPLINPDGGIIAFHDTKFLNGTREMNYRLRNDFYDGTFDLVEMGYGFGEHRCGLSILVKRSYHLLQNQNIKLQQCGSSWTDEEIYTKEREFIQKEIKRSQLKN